MLFQTRRLIVTTTTGFFRGQTSVTSFAPAPDLLLAPASVSYRHFGDTRPALRSVRSCSQARRSSRGGFAAQVVEQCGLVGGAQLLAGTRCVRVGARDAEV